MRLISTLAHTFFTHPSSYLRSGYIFISFCLCLYSNNVLAQPSNDNCDGAIPLRLLNGCTSPDAYNNFGATPSGFEAPTCFSGSFNDVWFSFVPEATDVAISIIGATGGGGSGGTLEAPEVALYLGDCIGELTTSRCQRSNNSNAVELYKGGLIIGAQYLIRVQGVGGGTGSFQICVNNFNPPVTPGSDCPIASILCNKETFLVQSVTGPGQDRTEADAAGCFGGFTPVESNSTWFVWTAANNGDLTFTLTPTVQDDDLDFVLFELPNGPNDCSEKRVIRCMASGDSSFPSRCMGPTGLRNGETDDSEAAGCFDPRQNNFIAPLIMEEGRSYALMINNFTSTGSGFIMEFGGDGEFLGPQPSITTGTNNLCIREPLSLEDNSTYALGEIVSWEWTFGLDADQFSATGQGPHDISYMTPGFKSVSLTITTAEGCRVTSVENFEITCCPDQFEVNSIITNLRCPDIMDGEITTLVDNNFPPLDFRWSTGEQSSDLDQLGLGEYELTISDVTTCDTVVNFVITSPEPFDYDTLIVMPTCNGGTDGTLELQTFGATAPYEYSLDNGAFSLNNRFENLSSDIYTVTVRDANSCIQTLEIPVVELELILNPEVPAIFPPSCTDFSDGRIEVIVSNGRPPYQFNWNDGRGFVDDSSLLTLSEGVYTTEVQDANLCRGFFVFQMEDPPPLELSFDAINASCFGFTDGELAVIPEGGVGNYTYQWDNNDVDSLLTNLAANAYTVTVADANGCIKTETFDVLEPPELDAQIQDAVDIICFGDSTGNVTINGLGGNAPFVYSLDGQNFQESNLFLSLPAGSFQAYVLDMNNCLDSISFDLVQPDPLIVDLGGDQTIALGELINLIAVSTYEDVSYAWNSNPDDVLSCQNCPNPNGRPVFPTIYSVAVTNQAGCMAFDSIQIFIDENRPLYIPNVFSPNGDGNNDFFMAFGGPAVEQVANLKVFDRWGNLIFDRSDIPIGSESQGWSGRFRGDEVESGTYVYMMEVQFINGQIIRFEGDITLIR